MPLAWGQIWVQTPFEILPIACIDWSVWLQSATRFFHLRRSPIENRTHCERNLHVSNNLLRLLCKSTKMGLLELLHCISLKHISSGC